MNEVGIDVSGQRSKGVGEYLGKVLFQYLITVCDNAEKNCPTVWPGVNQRMHWSFEDPAAFEGTDEAKLAKFREVRDQIEKQARSKSRHADRPHNGAMTPNKSDLTAMVDHGLGLWMGWICSVIQSFDTREWVDHVGKSYTLLQIIVSPHGGCMAVYGAQTSKWRLN